MKNDDILIQQYIDGELKEEDRRAFERRLEEDPELRADLKAYMDARRSIEISSLKQDLDELFERKKSKNNRGSVIPNTYWALAASLLLLIGLGATLWWQVNNQPHRQLYTEFYQIDRGLPSEMSAGEQPEAWEDPMIDFKRGQFREAELGFGKVLKKQPDNDTLLLYFGLTEMELNRPAEAQDHLDAVKPKSEAMYQKAQWYRALNLLKMGQIDAARTLLLKLEENHPYYDKAEELLLKLEEHYQ